MLKEDETQIDVDSEVTQDQKVKPKGGKLSPGECFFNRYRIVSVIDSGGTGEVYRALDERQGVPVALKRIKPDLLRDPQFRQRVALEKAASAIGHPGVVKSTDSHDDGRELVFIVYEFVEGETLHTLLRQNYFGIDETVRIGIDCCKALIAAHTKGFIHRDLKPKNIMLAPQPDGSSDVRILDFGFAKKVRVVSESTPTADGDSKFLNLSGSQVMIIGTPDYMSPEQALPEKVDFRTDIYSLGLVLYEMVAGFNPFSGKDPESSRQRVLKMPTPALPPMPSVPGFAELDRILQKCLAKRPEDRYASMSELLGDLKALAGTSVDAGSGAEQEQPIISRKLARRLFTSIQFGYLAMYAAAFVYLPDNVHRVPLVLQKVLQPIGLATFVEAALIMLCGAAVVRLYLLAAIAFDYEDLGRLFYRIFPLILVLDLAWALSPMLLFHKLGFITVLGVPCLAFLPFSQRTLVFWAYGKWGGRSSATRQSSPSPSNNRNLPPTPPSARRP